MRATLNDAGSKSAILAKVLLAPLAASLTRSEFGALISMIRNESIEALNEAFNDIDDNAGLAIAGFLMARSSVNPGASGASDVIMLAASALQSGFPLPVGVTMGKTIMLPDVFANDETRRAAIDEAMSDLHFEMDSAAVASSDIDLTMETVEAREVLKALSFAMAIPIQRYIKQGSQGDIDNVFSGLTPLRALPWPRLSVVISRVS